MGKKGGKNKDKKDNKLKKAKKLNEQPKAESKKAEKLQKEVPERRIPSAEERQQMIATAAYFMAEKQGFDPARERENWRAAELQIDEMLKDLI